MTYFFEQNGFKETWNDVTVNMPLDFSEIFNSFRITVFEFFLKNSRIF